jgi:2-polyprenyl-6-methoxyphenol hydroxylase-like FAD-dependent oxidoreductase
VLPRTLELFAMRGIAERWLETGVPVPSSHFALMNTRLDFSSLETSYPYLLFFPQAQTAALLEERALELGVPLLREHTVTGAIQDEGGVTVSAATPSGLATFRSLYAVGCEGGSSPIRRSAGIELVGSGSNLHFVLGDVVLDDPPDVPTVTLNGDAGALFMGSPRRERLPSGAVRPRDDARGSRRAADAGRTPCRSHARRRKRLRDAHRALDHALRDAHRYRERRLLLAGDSAHLFPPLGGQGLNLGLQDATNLAWKLAAVVRGSAPDALLGTYQAERQPLGAEVVDDTLAQMSLVAHATREGRALRKRFETILGTHPSVNREFALRLSGLASAYGPEASDDHPLVGRRAPDLELQGAAAPSIFGLLTAARFVFLNLAGAEPCAEPSDRLDVVLAGLVNRPVGWETVEALLIRPDGHVGWATNELTRASAARGLQRWPVGHTRQAATN